MKRISLQLSRHLQVVFLSLLALSLSALPVQAKPTSEQLYQSVKKDYLALMKSSRMKKYRDQWEKVIYGFEAVANRYPKSSRADDALYNAGMITLKLRKVSLAMRDADKALDFFDRLARQYPQSRYADDAQYMIGEVQRIIKKSDEAAYRAYALVPERFPRGDMAPKARRRLAELPVARGRVPKNVPAARASVKKVPGGSARGAAEDTAPGKEAQILGVRHWVGTDYVRVVIDLDHPAEFEKHDLFNPDRVFLSLKNTRLSPDLERRSIDLSSGPVRAIRMGQYRPDTARIVLDFHHRQNVTVFTLKAPNRIVIDSAGANSILEKLARIRAESQSRSTGSPTLSEQFGMKIRKVVIDAGHGGKDPGCISKTGFMEKDVTLDIARRLRSILVDQLGLEVIMTRTGDVFIPLEERPEIANRKKADLFISIHVNAAENRKLRGVETWFLDLAASHRGKQVAARENRYSRKAVSDLEKILNDLLLSNKTEESTRLADVLQGALTSNLQAKYRNVKSLGVKGAPFMVLQGAKMPSVLVEVSFMTNPTEEKRLKNAKYRQTIAQGLSKGVSRFMKTPEYAYSK
jgi:N-acetylmuramoyl-L-alanine amidase